MPEVVSLVADLHGETDELVAVLRGLSRDEWSLPTPASGWDISAQVAHLSVVDERAVTSMSDPTAFAELRHRDKSAGLLAAATEELRRLRPADLLATFLTARGQFEEIAVGTDPSRRMLWYGPDMSLASMVTARLMETWAHGQDVRDTLGVPPCVSERLRHIAYLGVATRAFSFLARGRPAPTAPVHVVLEGPGSTHWEFGNPDAPDRVSGSALDFCLLVTQRRHVLDTDMQSTPGPAAEWLAIAQAFAGPPGEGRQPGQFTRDTAADHSHNRGSLDTSRGATASSRAERSEHGS
jgi:uncharacterized protein (TIGR03084 family)